MVVDSAGAVVVTGASVVVGAALDVVASGIVVAGGSVVVVAFEGLQAAKTRAIRAAFVDPRIFPS